MEPGAREKAVSISSPVPIIDASIVVVVVNKMQV